MKYPRIAAIFSLFFLAACSTQPGRPSPPGAARVTFYNGHETYQGKRDRWGSKTASGCRAREGVTIAAPHSIPFGTRVCIPSLKGVVGDGNFTVQDRGRAVEKFNRLDVFVKTRRKIKQLVRQIPDYLPWHYL